MMGKTGPLSQGRRPLAEENLSPHETARRIMRQEAEKIARQKLAWTQENFGDLSPLEIAENLHELRVHQIELEMQNGELRQTQVELDALRSRYYSLYNLAPVGYFTLNNQGLVLEANLTAGTMLGVDRIDLVGKPLTSFIAAEDQDGYYLYRKKLLDGGGPAGCELRLKKRGGSLFWGRLDGVVVPYEADESVTLRIVLSDVTETKQAAAGSRLDSGLVLSLAEVLTHPQGATGGFLGFALEQAIRLTGSQLGEVHEFSEERRQFRLAALVRGGQLVTEPAVAVPPTSLEGFGLLAELLQRRQPLIINDYTAASLKWPGAAAGRPDFRNCLALPVMAGLNLLAVVILADKPADYDDYDVFQVRLLMETVWQVINYGTRPAAPAD